MQNENRRPLAEQLDQTLKDRAKEGVRQIVDYGKDVIQGKKLVEGLGQQDGALQGWLAHGSTELVNMMLAGHPAPVYARSFSPADTEGQTPDVPQHSIADGLPDNQVSVHGEHILDDSKAFRSSLADLFGRNDGPSQEATIPQKKMSR
ncbi:MAG: hypothetical protein KDB03_22845 [Planctomycetales bacterium]|nr:hypothetical protein [Planctomycetales bacterium]